MDHLKHLAANLTARKSVGDVAEVTITTPTRDLMNDTIDPMGMETEGWLRGTGAVFLSHDYSKLPVAKAMTATKNRAGIRMSMRWLDGDANAAAVKNAFDQGVLGASVGVLVREAAPNSYGGMHIARSTLTEVSLTGNPANSECVRMLKSVQWPPSGETLNPSPAEFVAALQDIRHDPSTMADLAAHSRASMIVQLDHAIRRQISQQIARLRGRVWDDEAAIQAHQDKVLELRLDNTAATLTEPFDMDELKREVRSALREALVAEVDKQVGTQLRRLTGRVD